MAIASSSMADPSSSSSKRAKLTDDRSNDTPTQPAVAVRKPRHLFTPYLALGIIANHVPFVLQIRHGGKDADKPDVNIVSSLGNCWSIWTAESLMQVFVGEQTPSPITQLALSTSPDSILASAGSIIYRYVRGKIVARYTIPTTSNHTATISHFDVFGDSVVAVAVSSDGKTSSLHHFSLIGSQLISSIDEMPDNATPTALLHPATYLNKVLVGLSNGNLALWNIRTGSLVHQFDAAALRSAHNLSATEAATSIMALAQAPALDIIALTTADNCVLVHNIKTDTVIATFKLESPLSSSPPTFRTDGRAHTMAIGSRTGDIFIFDLDPDDGTNASPESNRPRLIHTIRNAHSAPISGLEFVTGQPLLISSAGDNAIKQWFFEPSSSSSSFNTASGSNPAGSTSGSSSAPRLLKSREGHSEPPSLVRWYGEDGRAPLLSAARDRSVRLGWIGREARGGELSQGSIVRKANQLSLPPTSLKLEPASSLSFSLTRSRDWDDILTIHPSSPARIWYGRDRRMNSSPLVPKQKKRDLAEVASAGFVSHCGNFALVGSSNGTVGMWNMQSQRFIREFDTRPIVQVDEPVTQGKRGKTKKQQVRGKGSKVVGVVADEGNKELAVITASGGIFFFDFYTTTLLSSQQLHPIVAVRASSHATLLALIPLGLSNPLILLDFVTKRVVRKFSDIPARITDVTFSPTLRSLLISTMDGSLSTFDIPSGLLIDRMRLKEVIVSLDWSPDGTMIAGCGTEGRGIYLWSWTAGRGRVDEDEDSDDDDDDSSSTEEADEVLALPSVRGPDADEEEEEAEAEAAALAAMGDLQLNKTSYNPSVEPLRAKTSSGDGDASSHALITLTTQPRTKWSTLLNLDLIKARDKPKEAPKKPKSAPFFLGSSTAVPGSAIGSVEGLGPQMNAKTGLEGIETPDSEKRETLLEQMTRRTISSQSQSRIERLMGDDMDSETASKVYTHLLSLSAPQLDLTLRLELSSISSITKFIQLSTIRLQECKDYEAIITLIDTLRRVRSEEMLSTGQQRDPELFGFDNDDGSEKDGEEISELKKSWKKYLQVQFKVQNRVNDLLDYNIGTLSFLRGVPIV
ncbi:unnamed protein product [Sympodiomycopsis kandeliae]